MKTVSLRNRLLISSGVITLLTLAAVVVMVDISFRATIRDDLEEDLTFALTVAEAVRTGQMEDRIAETVQFAMDTRLRAAVETRDPPTVRAALLDVFPRNRDGWSAVIDPEGVVLAATPGAPVSQLRGSRELIDEAFYYDTGDLWSHEGLLVEVAASAILFGSAPLGVLVTGMRLDDRVLTSMEAAVGRAVVVRYGDAVVLGEDASDLSSRAQADVLGLALAEGEVRSATLDREQFLVASLPLLSGRGQPMGSLNLLSSLDVALQPSRTLRVGLLTLFVVGLALSLVASRLVFRAVTVPVNRLVEETHRLASGDLDHAIRPVRDDEIGQLAEAFEAMRVSLHDAREELIRAERLGAIGQAASAVAHDFAQPLTVIMGAVGMLELDIADPERRDRCFQAIQHELERLQRMKTEIVEFARGESSLDVAVVPVEGLVEQVAEGLRGGLEERGITLEISHGYRGHWPVDGYRIGRVIENLARNAAAALGTGGTIRIRTGSLGDRLSLEVEDDGPGIPDEILDRVFEPFVSHGKKNGTGLGLAIVNSVVLQHGGTIDVRSGPEGTCFTIQLPGESVQETAAGGPGVGWEGATT